MFFGGTLEGTGDLNFSPWPTKPMVTDQCLGGCSSFVVYLVAEIYLSVPDRFMQKKSAFCCFDFGHVIYLLTEMQ